LRCFIGVAVGLHWLKSPASATLRASGRGAVSNVTDILSDRGSGFCLTNCYFNSHPAPGVMWSAGR
jgi:hypothetical protein